MDSAIIDWILQAKWQIGQDLKSRCKCPRRTHDLGKPDPSCIHIAAAKSETALEVEGDT
jgi:hypothetical protein